MDFFAIALVLICCAATASASVNDAKLLASLKHFTLVQPSLNGDDFAFSLDGERNSLYPSVPQSGQACLSVAKRVCVRGRVLRMLQVSALCVFHLRTKLPGEKRRSPCHQPG